jgi:hypothetical protein
MDRQAFVEWLKQQPYVGPGYRTDATRSRRLFASLDRFERHLAALGIACLEGATLDALQAYDFRDQDDDDAHLGQAFAYLGREDLRARMELVSSDKYFRRKKLAAVFKDMDEMTPAVKALGGIRVHLVAEAVALGATPAGRRALAARAGLPCDAVDRLVQYCDLCRMTGMAGQALRRSVAMGYDALPKYRVAEPDEVRAALRRYLAQTGERTNAMLDYGWFVAQARQLPDLVSP